MELAQARNSDLGEDAPAARTEGKNVKGKHVVALDDGDKDSSNDKPSEISKENIVVD